MVLHRGRRSSQGLGWHATGSAQLETSHLDRMIPDPFVNNNPGGQDSKDSNMNNILCSRFPAGISSIVLAGMLVSGCDLAMTGFSSEARDEWTRSYPLRDGGLVEVRNTNGVIEVHATSGDRVEVVAERIVRAGSDTAARELLDRLEIHEDVSADSIRLEARFPTTSGFLTGGRTEVRFRLEVPANAEVRLRATNGQVRIDGVRGAVDATTTNGAIRGQALSGSVEARTTNGGIEIELNEIAPGGVSLSTTNGGIEVTLSRSADVDVLAEVTNGGIDVTGFDSFEPRGEATRRRLEGRANGGGARLQARTTNGGIRIAAR
jgi:hypothetical protein